MTETDARNLIIGVIAGIVIHWLGTWLAPKLRWPRRRDRDK